MTNQKYDKEELDQAAGIIKIKIEVWPSIKFSATTRGKAELGSFSLLRNDEDGELVANDLGKELKAVIINRGRLRLKNAEYISSEVSSSKETLVIFSKDKYRPIESGDYYNLKERYNLSTHQYPFVMLEDGVIAKIDILPASLNNLWQYLDSFKANDRFYHFWTTLKASEKATKSKQGGTYHLIEFLPAGKLDEKTQEAVYEQMMEVAQKIEANNEARRKFNPVQNSVPDAPQAPQRGDTLQDDDIPVIESETTINEDLQSLSDSFLKNVPLGDPEREGKIKSIPF